VGAATASLLVRFTAFELLVRERKYIPFAVFILTCYSTTLCLLHRAHMPPAGSPASKNVSWAEENAYPSRTIAYQAAGMITSIVEALQAHDQLRYTPAFM